MALLSSITPSLLRPTALPHLRTLTSQTDALLDYVRAHGQAERQTALDVLEGGIQREQDARGSDAVRLRVAAAEVHLAGPRPAWRQAATECDAALLGDAAALPEPARQAWALAAQLRASAALAQGDDAALERLRAAVGSRGETTAQPISLYSPAHSACRRHVDLLWNHATQQLSASRDEDAASAGFEGLLPVGRGLALKDSALALLSLGRFDEAASAAQSAGECASQVASSEVGGASLPLFRQWWARLLHAEADSARAQVHVARKEWPQAEAALTGVADGLEELNGPAHWSLAVPLLHLGYVYSRTGQVVLAEGLFRECLKKLNVSVDDLPADHASRVDPPGGHPSIITLAAWRFAQLLTALPRRKSEAERWAQLAASTAPAASAGGGELASRALQDQFGSLDELSGRGSRGKVFATGVFIARAFPGQADRD